MQEYLKNWIKLEVTPKNTIENYLPVTNTKTIILESSLGELKTIVVELICINSRPLSILEDIAIKRIFSVMVNQFGGTSINRNNKVEIKERAQRIKNRIKEELKDNVVSIKADIATRLNRSVLGINCQIIQHGKIRNFNLAMRAMKSRHTAENINLVIKQTLKQKEIYFPSPQTTEAISLHLESCYYVNK